jgi:hypothetical protein
MPYLFGRSAQEILPRGVFALGRGMKTALSKIYPTIEPAEGLEEGLPEPPKSFGPQYEGDNLYAVGPAFSFLPERHKITGVPKVAAARQERIPVEGEEKEEPGAFSVELPSLDLFGPPQEGFGYVATPSLVFKPVEEVYPTAGTFEEPSEEEPSERPTRTGVGKTRERLKGKRKLSSGEKEVYSPQRGYDLREEEDTPKGKRKAALSAYMRR